MTPFKEFRLSSNEEIFLIDQASREIGIQRDRIAYIDARDDKLFNDVLNAMGKSLKSTVTVAYEGVDAHREASNFAEYFKARMQERGVKIGLLLDDSTPGQGKLIVGPSSLR